MSGRLGIAYTIAFFVSEFTWPPFGFWYGLAL